MRRILSLVVALAVAGFTISPHAAPSIAAEPDGAGVCQGAAAKTASCKGFDDFQALMSVVKRIPAPTQDKHAAPPSANDEPVPPPLITGFCLGVAVTILGATDGNNTINGTEGDDVIETGDGIDTVNAGGGNDIICVGNGTKTIHGDEGQDLVSFANILASTGATGVVVDLEAKTARRRGTSTAVTSCALATTANNTLGTSTLDGIEAIDGTNQQDCLLGDATANAFEGRAGADNIDGRGGFDGVTFLTTLYGVTVDLSANPQSATTRDNGLFCVALFQSDITDRLANIENILGSTCGDTLTGSNLDNIIEGNQGNDVINGLGGSDVLSGGDGNDTLNGGDGDDVLAGGAGTDTLNGNNNDDVLEGGEEGDVLVGGTGIDTATYAFSETAVNVNLQTGAVSGGDAVGDTFNSIESLAGSEFDDTLTGNTGDNVLTGNSGNDTLNGGDGHDQADYSLAENGVIVNLQAGTATGHGNDTLNSIEDVTGSSFDDTLRGTAAANTMNGGDGDDIIIGYAGADTIDGGDGTDTCDNVDADIHTTCEDNDADGYLDANDAKPLVFCGIMRADMPDGQGAFDGTISIFDLSSVAGNFGRTVPPSSFRLDQDFDFAITIFDLSAVAGNFGRNVSACP